MDNLWNQNVLDESRTPRLHQASHYQLKHLKIQILSLHSNLLKTQKKKLKPNTEAKPQPS